MPVLIVSGERSFSKLKLIKTYLRSRNESTSFINDFAMMSIEKEIYKKIDFAKIIDQFAVRKARKQQLIA